MSKKILMGLAMAALIAMPLVQSGCKKEKKKKTEEPKKSEFVDLTVEASGTWIAYQLVGKKLSDREGQQAWIDLAVSALALSQNENIKALATAAKDMHMQLVQTLDGAKLTLQAPTTASLDVSGVTMSGTWKSIQYGVEVTLEKPTLTQEQEENAHLNLLIDNITGQPLPLKSTDGENLVLRIPGAKVYEALQQTEAYTKLSDEEKALLAPAALAFNKKNYDVTFQKEKKQ